MPNLTSYNFKVFTIRAHISKGATDQCPVKTVTVITKHNIYRIYEYMRYNNSDLFELSKKNSQK